MRAIYCVHLYNIKQHYIYNISHYQRITHNTQLTKNIWRVPPGPQTTLIINDLRKMRAKLRAIWHAFFVYTHVTTTC